MRRFRILFFLVAAVLIVPMVLLVRRTLESVDIERRARHETVAERLFDEMERSLSGFLSAEEERPFGHYGYEYTPPGESPGVLVRSPLSEPPAAGFVVGYFQIDPDGSLHSPLVPRSGGAEPLAADSRLSPQATAAVTEIERTVGGYWRSGARAGEMHAAANAQTPGSTLAFQRDDGNARVVQEAAEDERKVEGRVSTYDALRSLNKGVEQRAERQTKISREYASDVAEEPASADRAERGGEKRVGQAAMAELPRAERTNEADRFELSPMVGQPLDDRRLMLYRTVVHEAQGYRQGLLLDVEALGGWLREQALGASELGAYATVAFGPAAGSTGADSAGLVYQHRFAEPFEAVSARLALASLPGLGGAGFVYALAALSLAAALLGLAAIYRMVSVVLRYAEQRSNFAAAVTHELKTPLTAIRMYGEMLRDGMVASEAKRDEYHRHITAESERLTRLVNNVLEFSRLEKGARRTRLDSGDLGPVVREIAALVRPHVEGAGFALRVDVEADLPPARFERDALMQVVFNLVDNAVKYSDGAVPKEIVLGCRRDGDRIRLSVRDRGPGIAARHLRKIFEPFYRAENELTRRSRGTGLGLALVRALADEMDARVTGRNVPEGGFEVEIAFRADPR